MKFMLYFYVFAIFLLHNLSQNGVESISNTGLVIKNFTRIKINETCGAGGKNCEYFMKLCFSFSDALNCSIFNITPTLSWALEPGKSKIFGVRETIGPGKNEDNPLRVKLETSWKAQRVVLKAEIWRKGTIPVFIETLQLQRPLPYPVNDLAKLGDVQITECGIYFCLNVWLYTWCDDIPGCVGIDLSSTLPVQSSTLSSLEITSAYPKTTPLITTMKTHKTKTQLSKTLADYASETTLDHRITSTRSPAMASPYSKPTPLITTMKTRSKPSKSRADYASESTLDYRTTSTTSLVMASSYPKPTPLITTMKTRSKPSKTLADYASEGTFDHRTLSTTPGLSWLATSTSTTSSCASRSCNGHDNGSDVNEHGDGKSNKLVKRWWFWLCITAVVLLILVVVFTVTRIYKKRTSKTIQVTAKSDNIEGEEVYSLDDHYVSR